MSVRDLAILMGAGTLLELPGLLQPPSKKDGKSGSRSREQDHLRNAINRSLSYGAIYATHASSAWLFKILLRKFGNERLKGTRWIPAALCSAGAQLLLPEPLPGIACALMVPRALGHMLLERCPALARIPSVLLWLILAVAMNLQLWSRYNAMAPRWRHIMMSAAGMPPSADEAVLHRSVTKEVEPCDHPIFGVHPGETCAEGAVSALCRGLPAVVTVYSIVYIIKLLASLRSARTRLAWQQAPLREIADLLGLLGRSVVNLWISTAIGRIAFCLQSHLYPDDFKWWLGGITGFIAGFVTLLDSLSSRVELIEFNAGYIIHTESVNACAETKDKKRSARIASALLLGVATAAYVASEKGRGLLLLPMLAKVWKDK